MCDYSEADALNEAERIYEIQELRARLSAAEANLRQAEGERDRRHKMVMDLSDGLERAEVNVEAMNEEAKRLTGELRRAQAVVEAAKNPPRGIGVDGPWLQWWRELEAAIRQYEEGK